MTETIDLERIIIGELLHAEKQERIDALIELQNIKFNNGYQSLFNSILELSLADKEIDTITLFKTNGETPAAEISDIYHNIYSSAYLTQHIYLLKSKSFKEQISKIIKQNMNDLDGCEFGQDMEEIKNSLIIELSSLSVEDKAEFDDIAGYKNKIIEQLNSNRQIEGYSWGISDLDKWTSGIVPPRVYVIGGLKKSGKTRFLIQTIKFLHDQEIPVCFISLEMPAYEVTKLFYSCITEFNDLKFRAGSFMTKEERYIFEKAKIDEKFFSLESKAGLNLEQILSRIRKFAKMGFKVVAIDYIQRISHNRNKQAQELEDISIRLADSARQHNICLVMLSQLNALGEREIPNMGHLKGSGGIGESADTIILLDNLYRRTKKDDDKNRIDLYIEQRHGDSGLLKLQSDLGSCQFRNLLTTVNAEKQNEIF